MRRVADAEDAADVWLASRREYHRTGWWPVLVNEEFWHAVEIPADPDHAVPGTGQDWLRRVLWEDENPLADDLEHGPQPPLPPVDDPSDEDLVAFRAGGSDAVVLVPAPDWQVPEAVDWDGAVNYDMLGPDHTPVLRRWSGLFGAELLAMTRDQVVLWVTRPPVGAQAARAAALEAFAYCPDAVFQGSGTLEALTPMTASPFWEFWWD